MLEDTTIEIIRHSYVESAPGGALKNVNVEVIVAWHVISIASSLLSCSVACHHAFVRFMQSARSLDLLSFSLELRSG
jgi:hypothetical protein